MHSCMPVLFWCDKACFCFHLREEHAHGNGDLKFMPKESWCSYPLVYIARNTSIHGLCCLLRSRTIHHRARQANDATTATKLAKTQFFYPTPPTTKSMQPTQCELESYSTRHSDQMHPEPTKAKNAKIITQESPMQQISNYLLEYIANRYLLGTNTSNHRYAGNNKNEELERRFTSCFGGCMDHPYDYV